MINNSSIVKQGKIGSLLISNIHNKDVNNNRNKLTNAKKEFVMQILYQHFLFKYTNNKIINHLINSIKLEKFGPNYILYQDDSVGDKFFIIKEGSLKEAFKNSSVIKIYHAGDTFGDLDLLENRKRDGKMITAENVTIFSLKGNLFRKIMQKMNKEE